MVLGSSGNEADLDNIENNYTAVATELERAEIIAALERLETGRRNSFYNKVKSDGDLVRRAVDSIRSEGKRKAN